MKRTCNLDAELTKEEAESVTEIAKNDNLFEPFVYGQFLFKKKHINCDFPNCWVIDKKVD